MKGFYKKTLYRDIRTNKVLAANLQDENGKVIVSKDYGVQGIDGPRGAAPEMPRMVWGQDGRPCFKHLDHSPPRRPRRRIRRDQMRVPDMPVMKWKQDGSPDFSHLK